MRHIHKWGKNVGTPEDDVRNCVRCGAVQHRISPAEQALWVAALGIGWRDNASDFSGLWDFYYSWQESLLEGE